MATDFDFKTYQAELDARFVSLERELTRLLSCGVSILETWPGGKSTAWSWERQSMTDTDAKTFAETIAGREAWSEKHEAFIPGMSAAYVAGHLTNRSRGFGTTLQAFCIECGEETVAIPNVTDDEPDPVCAHCAERRQDIEPPDAADCGEL